MYHTMIQTILLYGFWTIRKQDEKIHVIITAEFELAKVMAEISRLPKIMKDDIRHLSGTQTTLINKSFKEDCSGGLDKCNGEITS